MRIEEFLEISSIDELIARKRNSFSRNVVLQYKDLTTHEELIRLANDTRNNQMIAYLFVCKDLTIHAIDEEQAPVSFKNLEEIYKNAVFILQYLNKKNAYALTMFRNEYNENNFATFFHRTYFSGSNAMKADRNKGSFDSFLDFGYVKCAMTLSKTYGIQDLLEVAWQKFNERQTFTYHTDFSENTTNYPAEAVRFIFSVEHPELSTITLFGDNDLQLVGKTQIMKDEIDKIAAALEVLKRFDVNRFNKI